MVVSEKPRIELIQGNCMPALKSMKDNQFDLAIVDPPYGVRDTWSKNRRDRFYKRGKLHKYQNKEIPPKRYFEHLQRVSKNQIIWGGNYFTKYLNPTNGWIVWWKHRNIDSHMSQAELAWTSYRKVLRVAEYQWNGAVKCEKVDKIHPHQKPVLLYKWLLRNYAKPTDTILDTHGGSMSLAIACYDMGFDLVCYELDKDYYKAAVERFRKHIAQRDLFKDNEVNTFGKQMEI